MSPLKLLLHVACAFMRADSTIFKTQMSVKKISYFIQAKTLRYIFQALPWLKLLFLPTLN